MVPSPDRLKTAIQQALPGVSVTVDGSSLLVQPSDLVRVCRVLKESPEATLDYVSNLTAVDYPPDPADGGAGRIDVIYHLYSMAKKHGPLTLKVTVSRSDPRVPSLVGVYRGAEFQEREVYDLYGVTFDGHPDLRRILMWEGFKGHPMRKDYVPEDQDVLEEPA
jgi:NADH/F420H2 dehydrogenase subunit C